MALILSACVVVLPNIAALSLSAKPQAPQGYVIFRTSGQTAFTSQYVDLRSALIEMKSKQAGFKQLLMNRWDLSPKIAIHLSEDASLTTPIFLTYLSSLGEGEKARVQRKDYYFRPLVALQQIPSTPEAQAKLGKMVPLAFDLNGYDLSASRIINSNLHAIALNNADLTQVMIQNSSLTASQLDQTNWYKSQISNSEFSKSSLKSSRWNEAKLLKVNFESVKAQKIDFTQAELNQVNFENSDLSQCIFRAASARQTNFRGANLDGCDFEGADLTASDFDQASVRGANFKGAILKDARMEVNLN